jgi:hypothetical protein
MSRTFGRRVILKGAVAMGALLSGAASAGKRLHAAADTVPTGNLARMLAFIPDQPDLLSGNVGFSDLGIVKASHGLTDIRRLADLDAKGMSYKEYARVFQACTLPDAAGRDFSDNETLFRDNTAYDFFQVDRMISLMGPDAHFARLEGAFDADAIAAALGKDGYTPATYQDTTYLTIRDDYKYSSDDPISLKMLDDLNRVWFDDNQLTSAPATALMQTAIDAQAQRVPTLDTNPTWQALAVAFADVASMMSVHPYTNVADARMTPEVRAGVAAWHALHNPVLTAMGYSEGSGGPPVIHAALVYASVDDANADAAELVARIQGYTSLETRRPLIPERIAGVTSRVVTVGDKAVLIADLSPNLAPGLWLGSALGNDTLYLAPLSGG